MKTYEAKVEIHAPADRVLELLMDPAFAERDALSEGAITARATVLGDDGRIRTLEIERQEHSHGPGGRLTDKRETNIVTQKWDRSALRNKWSTRVVGKERLVQIKGETWIEASGGSCLLREKGTVNIKVLVVGDFIACSIARDLEQGFPAKKSLIEGELGAC